MEKELVLEMKNIVKTFPGVKALNGANLNLYKGKVMALMGENGAGKSTLMKVMTGVYQKDSGVVKHKGKEVEFHSTKESQDAGIAIIHQELNLIPYMSIAENIFLGREITNSFGDINWKKMNMEARKLLDVLGVVENETTLVKDLTIGKMQMVEIAKALSQNAQIIVMDEPTDALADAESEALFKVIKELAAEGKSIVYISHRLNEIPKICDYITVMRDGQFIVEEKVSNIDENYIIEKMVGRSLSEQFPRVIVEKGSHRLKVENLVSDMVNNVSFEVSRGEILGIAGLMGSGRTELAKTIYGHYKKTSGTIYIDGEKVSINSPQDGVKAGIAYVSEDRKGDGLILSLSVKENMSLSYLETSNNNLTINKKIEKEQVQDYIKNFNIKTPSIEQIIKNLSGGNQQKVSIAKALLTNPKVLILDEPTRGVDVGAKKEIYDVINALKKEGLSIIIISSEMPEIIGLSDRILVMHENAISGDLNKEMATQEMIMRCAVGVKNDKKNI